MYKKIIVLTALFLTVSISSMDTTPSLQFSKLLFDSWTVTIRDNQWLIKSPFYQEPMAFSQAEITAIINMLPFDQITLFINNDPNSFSYLVDYIWQNNIKPSSMSQDTVTQSNKLPSNQSKQASEIHEYRAIMERVRSFTRTLPHTISGPKITLDKKMIEYRQLQLQGNVSKLEFEKKEMENALKNVNPLLRNTIFKGWAEELQKRINRIEYLLNKDITKKLNVVSTGSLSEAEAIVAMLKEQWPYAKHIVTTKQEVKEIQQYLREVGFNELHAVLNLLISRRDYHIKLAEKIYAGETVAQYEYQLAQKAFQYNEYKNMLQQRALRIEYLKNNPHELPLYKEFLSNNPAELKHIAIDDKTMSIEEFRQWCDQKAATKIPQEIAQLSLASELSLGVQPAVINILQSTKDTTIVTQKLDATINVVLENAYVHNYLVTSEMDWRLQAAVKSLSKSVNPQDFTFYVATIEHLLNDIQVQTALAAHQHPQLIERSPQLLAQAVTKYFEYLAPTEGEISLIVDLARYVSDVTVGTTYLSTEVRSQRMEQFWNSVKNISFDTISNLTAEQIIDGVTYAAARATYAVGLPEVIAVIKELAEGVRVVGKFAERFKKQFDQILQENPVIITEEGTVIANASKEALAEARQLIQAFDDMKEKSSDRKLPEILDDVQKMIEKEESINNAKIPVGKRGHPLKIISKNNPQVIDGVRFSGHALDQMQSRGAISPSAVLDVVKNPSKILEGNTPGTKAFIRDNLKVIVNEIGDIVTVILQ